MVRQPCTCSSPCVPQLTVKPTSAKPVSFAQFQQSSNQDILDHGVGWSRDIPTQQEVISSFSRDNCLGFKLVSFVSMISYQLWWEFLGNSTGAFPKAASTGPRASQVVWLFAPKSRLPWVMWFNTGSYAQHPQYPSWFCWFTALFLPYLTCHWPEGVGITQHFLAFQVPVRCPHTDFFALGHCTSIEGLRLALYYVF